MELFERQCGCITDIDDECGCAFDRDTTEELLDALCKELDVHEQQSEEADQMAADIIEETFDSARVKSIPEEHWAVFDAWRKRAMGRLGTID